MLSRSTEDYLESIYLLGANGNTARTVDIARSLGVSPASVTEMLDKLAARSLIKYSKYRGATLTKSGEKIGREISHRHKTLITLLEAIGVPKKIAERDACTIEHNLDPKTIKQIHLFVEFIQTAPHGLEWVDSFRKFCGNEEHRRNTK